MQYSDAHELMPKETLMRLCLQFNKTPEEICKQVVEMNKSVELWNRVHVEYGTLIDVQKLPGTKGPSFTIEVTIKSNKKDPYGKDEKTTRSTFQNDDAFFQKVCSLKGQMVRMWVTYVPNPQDQSCYRQFLDMESA